MIYLLSLMLIYISSVVEGRGNGLHNFHFRSSNLLYGTKLPQTVEIAGTYYLNPDHPEIKKLNNHAFFKSGKTKGLPAKDFSIALLMDTQSSDGSPYVCTKNVISKLANITQDNHDIVDKNLKALDNAVSNLDATTNAAQFNFDASKMETFYPTDGCQSLRPFMTLNTLNVSIVGPELAGKIFDFTFKHTFTDFVPVFFTDPFGGASFHYKQKDDKTDFQKESGHPLRYCDGVTYGFQMYTMEPRPVCPAETSLRREHEKGVLTVYKPNIVPVSRTVHRCQYGRTRVHSGRTFCCFGAKYNNQPLVTVRRATKEKECRDMVKDHTDKWYGTLTPTVAGNYTYSSFATHNDKSFSYSGLGSHTRDVGDAFLETAEMKVMMPSLTIVTPWGLNIPRSYVYKGTWTDGISRLVWEQFQKEELCLHVPRVTTNVEVVIYKNGDELLEKSPSPGATETTFFVSREVHGVWSVDDSMLLTKKGTEKFNCIRQGDNDKIYITKNGDIIKYSRGDSIHPKSVPEEHQHLLGTTTHHHEHTSFVEITSGGNGSVTAVNSKYSALHEKNKNDTVIKMKDIKTAEDYKKNKKKLPPVPKNSQDQTTWQEAVAYIEYERTETANENIHKRAIDSCEQSKLEWDMFVQLLDISPSRAISGRLRDVVQATHGGNGYYNVKRCELVFDHTILPTLFTNSTTTFKLNGKTLTARNISVMLGVVPSESKCFNYPIVKFRTSGSSEFKIGQLTRDGSIDTLSAKHLEPCRKSRLLVFNINDKVNIFRDYRLEATLLAKDVTRLIDTYESAHKTLKDGTPQSLSDPLIEYISKIGIIPLMKPLQEKKFKHYPTGQQVVDRYSVAESQAGVSSLIELMADRSYSEYATKVWQQRTIVDWTGSNIPSDSDGLGEFASGIAGFFTGAVGGIVGGADKLAGGIGSGIASIASGIGSGIGDIGSGVGSAVGDIGEGIGDGVGAIGEGVGKGVGALGEGIGNILLTIVLPIVAVIGVGVGGYFIYTKFIAKDPKGEVGEELINEKRKAHQDDYDYDNPAADGNNESPPEYEDVEADSLRRRR